MFVLQPLLSQPGRYDRITDLVLSTDIGSAASVSRLDREFVTPMRILALAFPPDLGGEEMQDSIDKFQGAMFSLARQARKSGTTGNVSGPSDKELKDVAATWETGRIALNEFFAAVNAGTQSDRLTAIPPNGKGYPRSERLYTQLLKDAALCRNRGGEALAGLWGQLMVYGTVPGGEQRRAVQSCPHVLMRERCCSCAHAVRGAPVRLCAYAHAHARAHAHNSRPPTCPAPPMSDHACVLRLRLSIVNPCGNAAAEYYAQGLK